MLCPQPKCESTNKCAMRIGHCCNYNCVNVLTTTTSEPTTTTSEPTTTTLITTFDSTTSNPITIDSTTTNVPLHNTSSSAKSRHISDDELIALIFVLILSGIVIIIYLIRKIVNKCQENYMEIQESRNIIVFRNPVYDISSPNYDPNDVIYNDTSNNTMEHIYNVPVLEPTNESII